MELSLEEISAEIDRQIGRLSPLLPTHQVIRNKFYTARGRGAIPYVKAQKKRSIESWIRLLKAAGVLGPKTAPVPEQTEDGKDEHERNGQSITH